MGKKVELRLFASSKMTSNEEEGLIRFPRTARSRFGFVNSRVVIGKGEYEISLRTSKAYTEDIQRLAEKVQKGELTAEEAECVGFVTRAVQQRVARREGSTWITSGVGNITIGCDPEFGLVVPSTNDLVRGAKVLPGSIHARFGADGPGVEVRPPPSRSHLRLTEEIDKILKNPPSAAEPYQWVGGATYQDSRRTYWFGGHVHLGRPDFVTAELAGVCYKSIAKALDHLVAFPLVSFDTPKPYLRRNGCPHKYGQAGDIRYDYPEQDRFEYRVLSGLWLVHPTLAKIVLGVSKCVAETAYSRIHDNGEAPEDISSFVMAPADRKGLLKSFGIKGQRATSSAINQAKPGPLSPGELYTWEEQLHSLDRCSEYEKEITALIEVVRSSPEGIIPKLDLNIRNSWKNNKPLIPGTTGALKKALAAVEEE